MWLAVRQSPFFLSSLAGTLESILSQGCCRHRGAMDTKKRPPHICNDSLCVCVFFFCPKHMISNGFPPDIETSLMARLDVWLCDVEASLRMVGHNVHLSPNRQGRGGPKPANEQVQYIKQMHKLTKRQRWKRWKLCVTMATEACKMCNKIKPFLNSWFVDVHCHMALNGIVQSIIEHAMPPTLFQALAPAVRHLRQPCVTCHFASGLSRIPCALLVSAKWIKSPA